MIVVVGRVRTDAAKRKELVRVGQEVASNSRQEAGCLGYRLYEDTEQENQFVFIEEWESQVALEQHFATPHVRKFMKEVQATLVAAPDVKFHTIASTMDIADLGAS